MLSPLRTILPISLLMPFLLYTSTASSSTVFMNSSNPYIKDWLEDLFIAKRFIDSYDGQFNESNFNTDAIENFKRMFNAKISKIFDESIYRKLSKLQEKKIPLAYPR